MSNLSIRDEPSLLFLATQLCAEEKKGCDGAWQIAPLFCSLPFNGKNLETLLALKERLTRQFPQLIGFGDRRAFRAYYSMRNSISKPSYIRRLARGAGRERGQVENIIKIAVKEPSSGGLVFSVFEPSDLERRYRPGFVPCLVSGSILLHDGEIQLNAFFRSQSIVEFGIQDLIFLRTFQTDIVKRLSDGGGHKFGGVVPGALNLHFGRVIVQRRLMRNRQGFVKREVVLEPWLRALEEFMLEYRTY